MSAADLSIDQLNDKARRDLRATVKALVSHITSSGGGTKERALEIAARFLGFSYQRTRAHYHGEVRRVDYAEAVHAQKIMKLIKRLNNARSEILSSDPRMARLLPPAISDLDLEI